MAADATSAAVPKMVHPHELTRVPLQTSRRCFSCRSKRRICDGCGQVIQKQAYIKEGSDYNICEACFNLGPGEGGLTQTATVAGFAAEGALANPGGSASSSQPADGEAEPARKDSMESADTGQSASTTASSSRKRSSTSSKNSFPVKQVEPPPPSNSGSSRTSGNSKDAYSSPRVSAAKFDFKLPPDADAQKLWECFATSTNPSGAAADECQGLDAAREAGKHLRFLRLTVKSFAELQQEQLSCSKRRCLELYSPFAGIPADTKARLIEAACRVLEAERSMGSLVGMAVGDAAGAPFEFIDAVDDVGVSGSYLDSKSLKTHGARNKFRVSAGQWTDDTAMGLCLADTLLARGLYDGSDSRVRYHNWWFRGYNNAFGNASRIGSVGLGGNVSQSLRNMAPGVKPSPTYAAKTQDAGNGTIMRLAPVPVFYALDLETAARVSAESSGATHPGPIAAAACAFQGFLIASCIRRGPEAMTASKFLDQVVTDFISRGFPGAESCKEVQRLLKSEEPEGGKEECWNWRAPKLQITRTLLARGGHYNGYPCFPDYFGSYCIDGLAVALWSFYHSSTYAEAVVRCVNFLGDADTMGAICGQIAGAFYGYKAIDSRWIDHLTKWDDHDIACRAALLWATRPRTPSRPHKL